MYWYKYIWYPPHTHTHRHNHETTLTAVASAAGAVATHASTVAAKNQQKDPSSTPTFSTSLLNRQKYPLIKFLSSNNHSPTMWSIHKWPTSFLSSLGSFKEGERWKPQSDWALPLAQQLKLFQRCSFLCTTTSNVDLCPSIYSRHITSLQKTLREQVIHSWCFFCYQTKRRFMSQKLFTKPLIPSLTKCLNLEVHLPPRSVQSKKVYSFSILLRVPRTYTEAG